MYEQEFGPEDGTIYCAALDYARSRGWKPEAVSHRIQVNFVRSYNTLAHPEESLREQQNFTDADIAAYRPLFDVMTKMYQYLSDGLLRLSVDIVLSDLELKQVSLYREYDTPATRYFHPDLDALLLEYEDYLYPYLMEYDTVVLVWNPGVRNMANAGERIFTLPGRNLQLKRGYMQIPAERIISEGPFLLPHEFFM